LRVSTCCSIGKLGITMTLMVNIGLDLLIMCIYTFVVWQAWRDHAMLSRSGLLAASVAAVMAFGIDLVDHMGMTEANFQSIYQWERTMITFSVLAMGLYQLRLLKQNWFIRQWDGQERRDNRE